MADADAARLAADPADRPFLTTGRQSLEVFLPWADRSVLVRVVDPPDFSVPPAWTVIRSRGPYALRGGTAADGSTSPWTPCSPRTPAASTPRPSWTRPPTSALPVVIISRPPAGNAPTVTTVADVLPWLTASRGSYGDLWSKMRRSRRRIDHASARKPSTGSIPRRTPSTDSGGPERFTVRVSILPVVHSRHEVPPALLRLAREQAGVVSREQVLAFGISRNVLDRLLRADSWSAPGGRDVHSLRPLTQLGGAELGRCADRG